ncbi:hypothetical protein EDB82DRAFT_344792 [Fusarium venenatum]|uniref:uncharacterized protein n=1 Tax=Fusarium venenatum TaxID=56646 RepID=UPI001D209C67|nr:hypothetical protein EDB82DRAFT_344792 [Fusarium venenatum]
MSGCGLCVGAEEHRVRRIYVSLLFSSLDLSSLVGKHSYRWGTSSRDKQQSTDKYCSRTRIIRRVLFPRHTTTSHDPVLSALFTSLVFFIREEVRKSVFQLQDDQKKENNCSYNHQNSPTPVCYPDEKKKNEKKKDKNPPKNRGKFIMESPVSRNVQHGYLAGVCLLAVFLQPPTSRSIHC